MPKRGFVLVRSLFYSHCAHPPNHRETPAQWPFVGRATFGRWPLFALSLNGHRAGRAVRSSFVRCRGLLAPVRFACVKTPTSSQQSRSAGLFARCSNRQRPAHSPLLAALSGRAVSAAYGRRIICAVSGAARPRPLCLSCICSRSPSHGANMRGYFQQPRILCPVAGGRLQMGGP